MNQARKFRPDPGVRYAVLSFVDPGKKPVPLPPTPGFHKRLVINAHDSTPAFDYDYDGSRRWGSLTHEQADRVAKYVYEVNVAFDVLLVHCVMGISRSPATGYAIASALKIGERNVFVSYAEAIPNRHVEQLLTRALTVEFAKSNHRV
jgi:predicted protein tyrosine phosphatase